MCVLIIKKWGIYTFVYKRVDFRSLESLFIRTQKPVLNLIAVCIST